MKFIFEQSDETLATHSGLAAVGLLISKTKLKERLNRSPLPKRLQPHIANGDVAAAYLGLLCQGKSDFDHIKAFRDDPFFKYALDLKHVPSSPTLRQRLDMVGNGWNSIILEESASMLRSTEATLTPCIRELVPLDIDVSPFDNSGTKKEGVSLTYKKVDGYAPIFAYLGDEGYCVNVELRGGSVHSQNNTAQFLAQAIAYARQITAAPCLVRMDSGFDSIENIKVCLNPDSRADFLIKRNLRQETPQSWLAVAERCGVCTEERHGKRVYTGETTVEKGLERPLRVVFKVTVRTISAGGQLLLAPEVEADTYYTSLPEPPLQVITLYERHGTSEQFHSEIKGELDLERLPSGKFATNNLVLHLGIMAYNILRRMGQESLKIASVPLRKKAARRRIRTVVQSIITLAARMVYHARRYKLGFSRCCPWFVVLKGIYVAFDTS